MSKYDCKTVIRNDIIDGYIRCNRREYTEFYNNNVTLYFTINDCSPLADKLSNIPINKQWNFDSLKIIIECYEKKHCQNGGYLSVYIDSVDL